MRVFAIGSPLGLRDAVTSGVITRVEDDYIVTDATILPGSSGGPLLTESGELIGINTLKVAETISAEGFGAAIPMSTIKKEFGNAME